MRYIIVMLVMFVTCMCLTSCDFESRSLRGGYAITLDGDTIPFYGGTITFGDEHTRDIRQIRTKLNSNEIQTNP